MTGSFVLTLSCPEQPGIVHAVTTVLNDNDCDSPSTNNSTTQ